jgi:hypothetical protein
MKALRTRRKETIAAAPEVTRDVISEENLPGTADGLLTQYHTICEGDSANHTTYAARARALYEQLGLKVTLLEFVDNLIRAGELDDTAFRGGIAAELDLRLAHLAENPVDVTRAIEAVDGAFTTLERLGKDLRIPGALAIQSTCL